MKACLLRAFLGLICVFSFQTTAQDWVEPMKKVHEKFEGNPGYVAQFGDSITNSMAFWSTVGWTNPDEFIKGTGNNGEDGLLKKPSDKRWRDIIKGANKKGSENGN